MLAATINFTSAVNQNKFLHLFVRFSSVCFCPAHTEGFPSSGYFPKADFSNHQGKHLLFRPPLQPVLKEMGEPHLVSAELKIFLHC